MYEFLFNYLEKIRSSRRDKIKFKDIQTDSDYIEMHLPFDGRTMKTQAAINHNSIKWKNKSKSS